MGKYAYVQEKCLWIWNYLESGYDRLVGGRSRVQNSQDFLRGDLSRGRVESSVSCRKALGRSHKVIVEEDSPKIKDHLFINQE